MPLIFLLRGLFSLVSLVLLGLAAYLLWTWWSGIPGVDADGNPVRIREESRLWWAIGLGIWSLGGGNILMRLLLGKSGGRPLKWRPGESHKVTSPTGATLHVEVDGNRSGPTMLLTHGWGLDQTVWQYAKEDLGTRYRIVTWDLPGLGRSQKGEGPLTLSKLATDLEAVITWTQADQIVLVGHSIGGMTIQTLAQERPAALSRVAGAVLINTTYTDPLRTMIMPRLMQALRFPLIQPMLYLTKWLLPLSWISAWQSYLSGSAHLANRLGFGRYVTKAQLEMTSLIQTKNSPAVQAEGNLAMFDWDATQGVSAFPRPLLVLGGDLDIVTKHEASEFIASHAPDAKLETAAGANHMGFLESPERYNQAILHFASTVSLPTTRTLL